MYGEGEGTYVVIILVIAASAFAFRGCARRGRRCCVHICSEEGSKKRLARVAQTHT